MKRKENVAKLIDNLRVMIQADTGLRNSQKKALQQFLDNTETPERGIFNLATGVGKTRIMSMLALAHLQSNPNSHVVVGIPNTELFQQEIDAFQEYRNFQEEQRKKLGLPALTIPQQLDMGVFNKDDKNTSSQIIFTSYQSLEKFSHQVQKEDTGLLLLDEAHHVVSDKRAKAVHSFTDALHYGMTATPWYSPERNVENVLGKVVAKISIRDAIQDEEPALAEYKNILMVSNLSVDLSATHPEKGDFKEQDYCEAILRAMRGNSANSGNLENWTDAHHYIAQKVAQFYHDYVDENVGVLNGKKCLINCRSQDEARIQAQELNKLFGHTVARMHTSDDCDDQTITDFKEGTLPIVCQVGKLTEGFDMPNLDMTINYPTCSMVREAQGAARCLRLPKVDSHTPGILPKKMGLVVDIAFKHPAYDNITDAIRQNGQILFQDVDGVGGPVIQHSDVRLQTGELDEKELKKLRKEHSVKDDERLSFTIVSDIKELQHLRHEADRIKEERYIPPKREGMRSSFDFHKEYGVDCTNIKKWLDECFDQRIQFYLDSDKKHEHPIDLVQLVKPKHGPACYCLDEHPEALRMFMKMHPEIQKSLELKEKNIPPKREGMKSSFDFRTEFGVHDVKVKKWFEECVEQGIQFYLDSDIKHEHPIDLIQYVKPEKGVACYCLDEHPEALRLFMEMHPEIQKSLERKEKNIPPKREGMRSSNDFCNEFGVQYRKIKIWFDECIDQRIQFYLDSDKKHEHPIDLVQYVKPNTGSPCYCLDEHPEALRMFMEMHPEIQKSLERKEKNIPPKREGMRSAKDFYNEFGCTPQKVKKWFDECAEQGIQFYLDSDKKHEHPIDLVQYVKPNTGSPCYCLDEHPEALRMFLGILLEKTKQKPAKQRLSSLLQTLQTASEKGGKVQQIVKAPNPPKIEKKILTKPTVKKSLNALKRSGPII